MNVWAAGGQSPFRTARGKPGETRATVDSMDSTADDSSLTGIAVAVAVILMLTAWIAVRQRKAAAAPPAMDADGLRAARIARLGASYDTASRREAAAVEQRAVAAATARAGQEKRRTAEVAAAKVAASDAAAAQAAAAEAAAAKVAAAKEVAYLARLEEIARQQGAVRHAAEVEGAEEAAFAQLPIGSPLRFALGDRVLVCHNPRAGTTEGSSRSERRWASAIVVAQWPLRTSASGPTMPYRIQHLTPPYKLCEVGCDTKQFIIQAPASAQDAATSYAPGEPIHGRAAPHVVDDLYSPLETTVPLHAFLNSPSTSLSFVVDREKNDGSLVTTTLKMGITPTPKRVTFGIAFPEATGIRPLFMSFDRTRPLRDVLTVAVHYGELSRYVSYGAPSGGVSTSEGHAARFAIGSPDRLNLFTVDGRMQRLDLEIDALLGPGYLESGHVIAIQEGNRLPPKRVEAIRSFVLLRH